MKTYSSEAGQGLYPVSSLFVSFSLHHCWGCNPWAAHQCRDSSLITCKSSYGTDQIYQNLLIDSTFIQGLGVIQWALKNFIIKNRSKSKFCKRLWFDDLMLNRSPTANKYHLAGTWSAYQWYCSTSIVIVILQLLYQMEIHLVNTDSSSCTNHH